MAPSPQQPHDRVAMPSRKADGTLDQTAPEYIGPVDDVIAGVTHQVQSQALAALDDQETVEAAEAAAQTPAEDPTPEVKARLEALEGTDTKAQAEVSKLHPQA